MATSGTPRRNPGYRSRTSVTTRFHWLVALLGLFAVHMALAAATAEIPARAFFEQYQFRDVKISPDGKYLAFIGPVEGHDNQMQIYILDAASRKVYMRYRLNSSMPSAIWWANSVQILFTLDYQSGSFGAPENMSSIWVMNIKTGYVNRIGIDGVVRHVLYRDHGRIGYVDLMSDGFLRFDQNAQYTWMNQDTKWAFLGPCSTSAEQGSPKGTEYNDSDVYYAITDNAGHPRLRMRRNTLTYVPKMEYAVPCEEPVRWRDVSGFLSSEPRYTSYGPWMFTSDNKAFYYVGHTQAGTNGLFLVDAHTWGKTLLFDDPHYDIETTDSYNRLLISDNGTNLLAFEYMSDRPDWVFIDNSAPKVELLKHLLKSFDGEDVQIVSSTVDGSRRIVYVSSDRNPGEYYLYASKTNTLTPLFSVLPEIDPKLMAPMQSVQFKARDGVTIHGYLTLPQSKSKNLPMIVLIHGGPFGVRDSWGFDSEVQFFAYHDYAVLQIEYRGSGGYGYAFQKAGYRQWGGTMQNDITDGTRWAIQQGIADPNRICIYGAGYGGYAALEGVVEEPNLYKCAVGYAGVYDLMSFRGRFHILHYEAYVPSISTQLGNNLDYLRAHSPVFHVDRIKAALFLAYGGMDQTVSISQADELRDALDKIHKPCELVYYRNEGHGFYKLDHRVTLYTKMLAFFDKYIGQPAVH